MVETNITKRWEQGTEHHPKSIKIYKAIEENDLKYGGDYFCWKSGGDGDNGEHLMYLLDIYFEMEDEKQTVVTNEQKLTVPEIIKETLDDIFDSCEQCGEKAWDGRICHVCGLKII